MNKTLTFLTMLGLAWVSAIILSSNAIATANDDDTSSLKEYSQRGSDHSCNKAWKEGVKEAIEANDYSLLSQDAQANIDLTRFEEMVAMKAEKEVKRAEFEAILQLWDFEAFRTFETEMKAKKVAAMEEKIASKLADATEEERAMIEEKIAKKAEKMADKKEPTTQELQEKFNKLTSYYSENGTLPEGRKGNKGKRGGVRGTKRGNAEEGVFDA